MKYINYYYVGAILFLYLLLLNFFISSVKITYSQKTIDVNLFYNVFCGDSVRAFRYSALPFYKNREMFPNINLKLIPGAKMSYEITDKNIYFSCKHGDNECFGNTMHACALNKLSKSEAFKYIICYMNYIAYYRLDNYGVNEYCSQMQNISTNLLTDCAQGNEGKNYMITFLKRKNGLDVYWSPQAFVNGKSEDSILSDLTEYACKILDSKKQSNDVCNKYNNQKLSGDDNYSSYSGSSQGYYSGDYSYSNRKVFRRDGKMVEPEKKKDSLNNPPEKIKEAQIPKEENYKGEVNHPVKKIKNQGLKEVKEHKLVKDPKGHKEQKDLSVNKEQLEKEIKVQRKEEEKDLAKKEQNLAKKEQKLTKKEQQRQNHEKKEKEVGTQLTKNKEEKPTDKIEK